MMRLGTFIKTPSPHIAEILGLTGLDYGIIDAEHGPFDRNAADLMMIGGRAANFPLMVRVANHNADTILWALDIGACGLIVPHVDTKEQAAQIIENAKFKNGKRGFSNSARFGNYGKTTIIEAIELGDNSQIYCQIESESAVVNSSSIAALDGVDGLMIGRADLALSMGLFSTSDAKVLDYTKKSIAAALLHAKRAIIVISDAKEIEYFAKLGVTDFIIGSDQGFMRNYATQIVADAKTAFEKL